MPKTPRFQPMFPEGVAPWMIGQVCDDRYIAGASRGSEHQNEVNEFYDRIWNAGDLSATSDLLSADFSFRGSLGNESIGRDAFGEYVCSFEPLLPSIIARSSNASRMTSGRLPRCASRGYMWPRSAAFSRPESSSNGQQPHSSVKDGLITELWVLGDLAGLDALLKDTQNT